MAARRTRVLPVLIVSAMLASPARAQNTADPAGQAGFPSGLSPGAVRPVPDLSVPCRHGTDGPGPPGSGACPGGRTQPVDTGPAVPFTGGVFGPGGRGPDPRPAPRP